MVRGGDVLRLVPRCRTTIQPDDPRAEGCNRPPASVEWPTVPPWGQYSPHLVAAIAAAFALAFSGHVVLTKRDPRAAALWLGLIWFAPVVGVALYFFAGINRMPRPAARRAQVTRGTSGTTRHRVNESSVDPVLPLVAGNRITPLLGGDAAYPAMLDAIAAATDTVLMCTYIFDNDRAGKQFCRALGQAVARGVDVRVMIDAMGARYSLPSMVGPLRRAGVRVVRFSRTFLPWRLRYANLRNHRKLLVVDGRIGFAGGMNIREECLLDLAPTSPTQDLHFRVEGPAVADIQRALVEDWEFCTRESLRTARYFPPLSAQGDVAVRAIPDGPDRVDDPILWSRLAAIARAKRRIRIATPYFVPDPAMITALCVAATNGAQVEILLPATGNLRLVQWASTSLLGPMLERGCRAFTSALPFDHMKLMLVDDDWAQVGSANWDARSFRLNFEFDLECHGRSLAIKLHDVFDARLAQAHELSLAELNGRNLAVRLRDGFASVFAPYL